MYKVCKKCNSEKSQSEFYKNNALSDGLTIYCKSCLSKPKKEKKVIDMSTMTEKKCVRCESTKPLKDFNKNKSSKDGLTIYCKTCCNTIGEKYRAPKKEKIIVDYSKVTEKYCRSCNLTKSIDSFGKNKNNKDGLQFRCKECCENEHKIWREKNSNKRNEWNKKWREANPEKAKDAIKNWRINNPEKIKERRKQYFLENPEKKQEYWETKKRWIEKNPEKYREIRKRGEKKWREKNPEKVSQYLKKSQKKYYEKNKEKINAWLNSYMKERRENDILFKLSSNYRTRLYMFYKNSSIKKPKKTNEIIGCSWEQLHKHIESKFLEGMSNENYGSWHIDHIIPLASAKNEEELVKLCHYTNLQPLWAEDNLKKNDKIL